jgi:spore maturation protein CgeB
VCFVGARYGFRPAFVSQLEAAGIRVTAVGPGWPSGAVPLDEMIGLMQRAKIILGLGGIGWSLDLKNVKGRDFEAPCVGTYVTSFNPDLAEMFRIGEEIACYSTVDEAIEVVRGLLRDAPRRRGLAERGRARCVAEHTWDKRFEFILQLLGILQ